MSDTLSRTASLDEGGLPLPAGSPLRALLVENIDPGAVRILGDAGVLVETVDRALEGDELLERSAGVHLLGVRSGTMVTEKVLDAAPILAVGAFCIGTNQIDLAAASRRGVAVFNAPFSNTRSVVELVLAEIIALTRRLTVRDRAMHAGVWDKSATGSHEVRGRRLGIVGYGNIGSQLSVLAENLGMSVWFYDTTDRLALGNARRCSSLEELLESVDVVTLHVDGRPANRGLFGEQELARMRPGSLFLNLSRGFVIDHGALRRHLESGHLAGAAIDVFGDEPRSRDEPFRSALQGMDNVILTPHVGGSTVEAQVDIGQFVAHKLLEYVRTGNSALSVNFPNLELPGHAGAYRLAHLHRNVPGVLATINGIFADHGVNVDGQYLGTRGDLGYVITDLSQPPDADVIRRLEAMEETVALRAAGNGNHQY
jgi:D-3-phosphoglycerate dehydrogenase / 2-oxoglutarate reductase